MTKQERKLLEAKEILASVGMPQQQCNDMCAYCLLALSSITPKNQWYQANNEWIGIHDILTFIKENYGIQYAENSRETFRKQALHHFRNAAIIEDNSKPTNSPNYKYRLTKEALDVFQQYSTVFWKSFLQNFLSEHDSLINIYSSKRNLEKIPLQINGSSYSLSGGIHNELQKAILEEFAPRFAQNAKCLYIGDSTERDLYKDEEALNNLKFDITLHDKMPDVVLYLPEKDWVYFIEAVTSVGPMSPKRILEIQEMTEYVTAGKIYITAFPDMKTFKKFSEDLAWETEVWLADNPNHMIHLNGTKFVGPYNER